jgi:mono/diheme cytochrome c family protein
MKVFNLLLAVSLLYACSPTRPSIVQERQDTQVPQRTQGTEGAENYALKCAGCHDPGPGHPATMLLTQLGRPVPALIGRDELQLSYLQSVVRRGLIEMPPFRPTELSDADIEGIYAYIKQAEPVK